MKFLDNLFKKKDNPFFAIFKQALPKGTDLSNSKVYHIKSFEYTDSNMELFNKNRDTEDLYYVLDKLAYNSQSNNVGIYYVVNLNGQNEIYLVSDPLELLEKEYIMEKYNGVLDDKIMQLNTVKQIN